MLTTTSTGAAASMILNQKLALSGLVPKNTPIAGK